MIPSRGVDSSAKNTPTDWDLTSSATGTVKRRPSSLESCKSNSPTTKEDNSDFPIDNRKDDVASASCKINKTRKSEKNDLSQEIVEGSSSRGSEDDEAVRKIDNQPTKKRFFDLKLTESAKKSLSSKLKLPNRVSLTLSSRKTLPNNKLSLSQLEQQNNLFIRDGPAKDNDNNSKSGEPKINKQEENNKIFCGSWGLEVVMERPENGNPKQKQDNLSGGKVETAKSKKSSLIPAFLGGSTKNANHIKIPSASGSIKKAPSTTQNVVEKLTKTGNKFKELYRDFPSSGDKAVSTPSKTSLKRNPPPYRPPPTPPCQSKQNQLNVERQQKRIRFSESDARNYEEIDAINEENVDMNEDENKSNCDDISSTVNNNPDDGERITVETTKDMLSKAEYSSNVFKNIPVRQRKGVVSHMENYQMFDPSVDFCNEKELMKKKLMSELNSVRQSSTPKQFQLAAENDENIEDVTFEDQTVYDVSELDERENILAHHNYYEIDPDLLLEEDEENDALAAGQVSVDRNQTVRENRCQSVSSKKRKSKIYSNTCSTSSDSTSTSQTSNNSSSTTTSSDYPSLFNSVIETTQSSTVESTDDNDSNGYGKTTGHAPVDSSQCGDTINQVNVSNESIITISNVVTCGESNASSTGATKKKSPQLNRIIRPSSSSSTRNVTQSSAKQQTSSLATKTKSTKINLPFYNKTIQLDPLKSSHSLPQLQNVTVQNRCRQQGGKNEFNFVIDNTTTIQLRRQHNSRQGRPLSGHNSDDRDSGFLSPVTPPDSQHHPAHITPNVIIKESEPDTKTASVSLNQCDTIAIQQLIEVSNSQKVFRVSTYEHSSDT